MLNTGSRFLYGICYRIRIVILSDTWILISMSCTRNVMLIIQIGIDTKYLNLYMDYSSRFKPFRDYIYQKMLACNNWTSIIEKVENLLKLVHLYLKVNLLWDKI